MKKVVSVGVLFFALIAGVLIFYRDRTPLSFPQADIEIGAPSTPQKWESRTDDQSAVTITVTPIDISPQSKEWKFDIVMNTHSVELDQDLTKSASLIDVQGKEYKPLNWEGTVGGHHREGVLTFNRIMPAPQLITLKISGVGDVERSFTWQLK
ncbi:MAG: hypothetical protein Q8P97_00785 [bacterium]|nr:hypothetical protein [bacterium]